MKIEIRDTKAYVYTPYNPQFVREIKAIGGAKWNGVERCWMIPKASVDTARKVMMEVYGETDLPDEGEKVTVRVAFDEDVEVERGPVVIYGRVIASAYGRDSGAKVGEGVTFIKGMPRSGGSRNYWETIIPEGCVVEIRNIPVAAITDDYKYEVVKEKAIDKEALEAEKEKLLKRLAEIEALLA